MGLSNFLSNAEGKIANLKGELGEKRAEVKIIEEGVSRLSDLYAEIKSLEERIAAGIAFVKPDYPDWKPDAIKPHKKGTWKSPFKAGEMGRTALSLLRENGGWMSCRDIAKVMLDQIGHDSEDRLTLDKIANTLGNYLRKKDGDLVESNGEWPVKYRVIRQFDDSD